MNDDTARTPRTPPDEAAAPFRADVVSRWLIREAGRVGGPRALLDELCPRLIAAGLPLYRASFHLQTLHPQLRAQAYIWRRDAGPAVESSFPRDMADSRSYTDSPVAAIYNGAGAVRCRLDVDPPQLDYPLMAELKAEGVTDYVMLPQAFSDGTIHAISLATDRPGGFTGDELAEAYELLPLVALLLEAAVARKIATTVLETYVGREPARRVLAGEITLGSGQTVHAVLWYCDLRDYTVLSDSLPRDEMIALLNAYFACMVDAVHGHGGTVLKYMGDGVLAIFPCGGAETCGAAREALAAAGDALAGLDRLNAERAAAGKPALRAGVALHLGEVTYGNIGAGDRLDFTVVGPAVNEVARVERMCRELEHPLLITAPVAAAARDDGLVPLGAYRLRGVAEPQELFTTARYAPSPG